MIQSGKGDWITNSYPFRIRFRSNFMVIGQQEMYVVKPEGFYLAASHRQIKSYLLCVLGVSAVKIVFWTRMGATEKSGV